MQFTELFEAWERAKKKYAVLDGADKYDAQQEIYAAEDALNDFFKGAK